MTDRTALALWLLVALLVAVGSGATTYAVLTDEETVSVTVSADVDAAADAPTVENGRETIAVSYNPAGLVDTGGANPNARTPTPAGGERG